VFLPVWWTLIGNVEHSGDGRIRRAKRIWPSDAGREWMRTTLARLYVFIRFHAQPGLEDALRAGLLEILGPTRAEPGCLEIHLYAAQSEHGLFYIRSFWRDEAAFDAHAALPHMRRFLEQLPRLIDHPLEAVRTDMVD
jgi:quinol monooxygenase YgiN